MIKRIFRLLTAAILAAALLLGGFLYWFPTKHKAAVERAAGLYGLEPSLIAAQIKVESNYNADAVSAKGATGLMQLLPETGQWCAEKLGRDLNAADLTNPTENITLGCWYMQYLLAETGSVEWALAAYNAGLSNVRAWWSEGICETADIPFAETRSYVEKVMRTKKIYDVLYQ